MLGIGGKTIIDFISVSRGEKEKLLKFLKTKFLPNIQKHQFWMDKRNNFGQRELLTEHLILDNENNRHPFLDDVEKMLCPRIR